MSSIRQVYYPPLLENQYYHIYNRGNNGDNLFYSPENYHYFLRQFDLYLGAYTRTYAYCLLPNHFHLLIEVVDFTTLPNELQAISHGSRLIDVPESVMSEQFRRFFSGYAKAIKVQESRTGSLFEKNFQRKLVDSEAYFTNLIAYIHRNPQRHDICDNFVDYPYSSYSRHLHPRVSKLQKKDVLDWFGGAEPYKRFHQKRFDDSLISNLIIEAD